MRPALKLVLFGATSSAAGSVVDPVPVNSIAPVISGTASVGQTLSCTTGTWTNTPTSYAYQWKRDAVNIGATTNSYLLVTADADTDITCAVTATNAFGPSLPAISNTIAVDPIDTTAPVLSSPDATAGATTAGLAVSTTEAGTGYVVVTQSATQPSAAQIMAGQNHLGAAADYDDSMAFTTGVQTFPGATGLTILTAYHAHFFERDAALNSSNIVTDSFTTTDLDAGTLTWVSDDETPDPVFSLADYVAEVGDILTLEIDDNSDFSSLFDSESNTLDAEELAAGTITFSGISSLAVSTTYYARVELDRGGSTAYSNTVSQTMATPATYTGPGDIAAAVSWFGLRAYSEATIGDPLIRIARNDDTEQDFVSLADGSLDVASIATFVGGGTARVAMLYDQGSANRDMAPYNPTAHPTLVLSGVNGKPQIQFVTLKGMITTGGAITTISQPYTASVVARRTSAFTVYHGVFGGSSSGILFADGANYMGMTAAGGVSYIGSMADSTFHSFVGIFNGASSAAFADGSARTLEFDTDPGSTGIVTSYYISGFGGSELLGDFREGGFWGSALDLTTRTALDANQTAFW